MTGPPEQPQARSLLARVGPGVLVAATGVGAGDLATAALTGGELGTAVLWAVIVGAGLKYALTEGLARYQLATGETILEGAVTKLGRPVVWIFLPYLLLWSFFVGSALISACGVTLAAIAPIGAPTTGKVVWGIGCSLLGLVLVLRGGFQVFERVMAVTVALMVVVVLVTAVALWPGTGAVLAGLVPSRATLSGPGLGWTVALIGGVGGTLTILAYGYWIREAGLGQTGQLDADLRDCRVDLAVGYGVTALFGLAMVVIGATVPVSGKGAGLMIDLSARLGERLGPVGRWAFLLGAFGAVFSSLLGVWQSVPYLFADFLGLVRAAPGKRPQVDERSPAYRGYLVALATLPVGALFVSFKQVQKLYAVIGAGFLPLLALALLILNGRRAWVGESRNGWPTTVVLVATLLFFAGLGLAQLKS